MGEPPARHPREIAVTRRLVAASAHPLRAAILLRLAARPSSIGELSADAGEPKSKVRYHARKLIEDGLIEIAGKRATRGTAETLYRPAVPLVVSEEEFSEIGVEAWRRFSERGARLAFQEILTALRSGGFGGRMDSTAVHMRMFLDEQGWEEMAKVHLETLERSEQIRAEAAERLQLRGETGMRSATTQFLYALPGPDE
jgi:DNA-binding transcriptional ArsR family regulator